jgi:hypothetical protein
VSLPAADGGVLVGGGWPTDGRLSQLGRQHRFEHGEFPAASCKAGARRYPEPD